MADVYWIGQDGNYWVKNAQGVQNFGKSLVPLSPQYISSMTQIPDPAVPAQTSGPASVGGASSAPAGPTAADQAAMADEQAYWGDQIGTIDAQLGRLPGQQQTAENNVVNSYNSAYGRLTDQKGQANRNYTTTKDQTAQDNEVAKTNIDTGVRNTLTGAQRLLGGRGSGSSSAFSVAAPYAAGEQGNQQRRGVQTSFERNNSALDTNWTDYMHNWDTSVGDLGAQRDAKLNAARSQSAQTEAGLQEQKQNAAVARSQAGGASYRTASAQRAPYQARIQQLLSSIDQLGAVPQFNPQAVNYNAPTLDAYNVAPSAAASLGSNVNPQQGANLGAFWTLLGGDPRKKDPNQVLQPAL